MIPVRGAGGIRPVSYTHLDVYKRQTQEIAFGSQTQKLSGKEFQVLEMMMRNPRIPITTDQFITRIWGWETSVDTSVVWVHISNLRKKLDRMGVPLKIRFVRNVGYALEVGT